jgi:EmrB/QacA subfamily drug resistance transporter
MTVETVAPPVLTRGKVNAFFATIMLGVLIASLDQTIVATALPTIVADLGGAKHMAWVVTGYLLAETIAVVLVGKFGDLFGRKRIFMGSVLVFTLGSVFAGLAGDMTMLVIGRAVQGVGGGGLLVTATALITDVIPLRLRGKYQGVLGAMFGVTTIGGPLLGGYIVDDLNWHWLFYVNVPFAVVMLALAVTTIPSIRNAIRPTIDYLGIVLVSIGAAGLTLGATWGGTQYPWGSPVIITVFAVSAVALVAFVLVELRAAEPMLPMRLFRDPVFTISAILSFVIGFAMLGVLAYLPTYFQYVDGNSSTISGLRGLPMIVGLMLTAIISGNAISKNGKYRKFPIASTSITIVGLWLMSTMNANTGPWLESLYLFVLGAGIGLAMQVLTIVVQNTVDRADLGTATSGVTFFRSLGSSFGTAIFGTIYASKLSNELGGAIARSPGVSPQAATNPRLLHQLPDDKITHVVTAYSDSIGYVFTLVVPVIALGFVISLFLKEIPLRKQETLFQLDEELAHAAAHH